MIDFTRLAPDALSSQPYRWAFIDQLFSDADKKALVSTFPRDHFKTVEGYDGEKGFQYEARSLVGMGTTTPTNAEFLSPVWKSLAEELLSPAYRSAMSQLTELDLNDLPMEVNVFHYGRSAWLGPHVDLEDKVVTHVFYFNEVWSETDGGCLAVLRSAEMADAVRVIPPLAGNSVVLVRSQNSWHAVTRVSDNCRISRRSMTLTFYRPGSPSTMWPVGDVSRLHDYSGEHSALARWVQERWRRIAR
jgi:SM-20-related protein